MIFWHKRHDRATELAAQAEAVSNLVDDQQERVNALTGWLQNRKDQNGFGDDFEFTLKPKESR